MISRNIFSVRVNFSNFHSVESTLLLHSVEKRKIYTHWRNISSNQLFSNFFWRYFHGIFAKNAWERIPVISTLWIDMVNTEIRSELENFSWNQFAFRMIDDKYKMLVSRNFPTSAHSVKITESYSHSFLAKIPWNQRFY